MRECYFCKKESDKLYELRGWEVCYDCYFEDIDKDLGKEEIDPDYEAMVADLTLESPK